MFRVAVESGAVRYYRNNVLVYTSSVVPAFPLGLDTTLYSTNATIAAAAIRK